MKKIPIPDPFSYPQPFPKKGRRDGKVLELKSYPQPVIAKRCEGRGKAISFRFSRCHQQIATLRCSSLAMTETRLGNSYPRPVFARHEAIKRIGRRDGEVLVNSYMMGRS